MGLDFSNQVAVCCHWVPSLGPLHLDVLCLRCPFSVERKLCKSSSKSTHLCSKLFILSLCPLVIFGLHLSVWRLPLSTTCVCWAGRRASTCAACSARRQQQGGGQSYGPVARLGVRMSFVLEAPCPGLHPLTSLPCPKKAEPETKAQVIPRDQIGGPVECNRERRQTNTKEHFPVGHRCGQLEPVSLGPAKEPCRTELYSGTFCDAEKV